MMTQEQKEKAVRREIDDWWYSPLYISCVHGEKGSHKVEGKVMLSNRDGENYEIVTESQHEKIKGEVRKQIELENKDW